MGTGQRARWRGPRRCLSLALERGAKRQECVVGAGEGHSHPRPGLAWTLRQARPQVPVLSGASLGQGGCRRGLALRLQHSYPGLWVFKPPSLCPSHSGGFFR